jgi:hypothetical protein
MDSNYFKIDDLERFLYGYGGYDIYRTAEYETVSSEGWKLSLQGKNVIDALYLYNKLIPLLSETQTPYKIATENRFLHHHPEQSKKAMTIYVRDDHDVKDFAEKVYNLISDYDGHNGVAHPTSYEHYKSAIYFRNDRDENGNYITAN